MVYIFISFVNFWVLFCGGILYKYHMSSDRMFLTMSNIFMLFLVVGKTLEKGIILIELIISRIKLVVKFLPKSNWKCIFSYRFPWLFSFNRSISGIISISMSYKSLKNIVSNEYPSYLQCIIDHILSQKSPKLYPRAHFTKYQSPKETGTQKYTDKIDRQTNTQLPTVIARISKSNT